MSPALCQPYLIDRLKKVDCWRVQYACLLHRFFKTHQSAFDNYREYDARIIAIQPWKPMAVPAVCSHPQTAQPTGTPSSARRAKITNAVFITSERCAHSGVPRLIRLAFLICDIK